MCRRLRMIEECYPFHFGRNLLESFQPFPTQLRFEIVEACNVSARMRQARNEAASDRIGDERLLSDASLSLPWLVSAPRRRAA